MIEMSMKACEEIYELQKKALKDKYASEKSAEVEGEGDENGSV